MNERMTLYKWFWAWEFEKEEAWLNEQANAGWVLDGVGFCAYHFIRTEQPYTIRLELREADPAYLEFMQETGAEYVGRIMQWHYYRKRCALGSFELFSDLDSRIAHLNRVGRLMGVVGTANLCIGVANSLSPARVGWVNLLCSTLLMYGLGRIHGKREELEKQRRLHE